jgi:cellobiose transport system permease protein
MHTTLVSRKFRAGTQSSKFRDGLRQIRKNLHAYLFISPFFILFAIFFIYPTLRSIGLSLYEWEGFNTLKFVGLENYSRLFKDKLFIETIYNSFFLMVVSTIPQLALATLIAVALNSKFIRFRNVWRAAYFSPIVISPVVVGIVFSMIFDQQYGFLNYVLGMVGIDQIGWINTAQWSKIAVAVLVVWRWTGWNMVVILAGLQSIPEELYDAAKVDGAADWNSFRYITLPLLKPILNFLLMLCIIDGLRMFAEPNVLTKGGPGNSSETMIMYLYNQAFMYFKFGYASAEAVVIFVALAGVAAITWGFLRRGEER